MERGLISVIIPIFNADRYLRYCIDSVIRQTYQRLEVFLIDDGSNDSSASICEEYSCIDKRVIFIHRDHEGVSSARNYGIEIAKGEWITFVDADDALEPDALERLLSFSDQNDIICCSCSVIDGGDVIKNHFFPENRVFSENKEDLFLQLLDSKYLQKGKVYTAIGTPWGKLYSRQFLLDKGLLFDTSLVRAQDNIFNMYAFKYAKKIHYINECLYIYRCEHISEFAKEYNYKWYDWLLALQLAREEAMKKLALTHNERINKAYTGATVDNLVYLMRIGVFNKKNPARFEEKVKKADRVVNMPCFKVLDERCVNQKRIKTRGYYCLIKHRRYKLLDLITRFG